MSICASGRGFTVGHCQCVTPIVQTQSVCVVIVVWDNSQITCKLIIFWQNTACTCVCLPYSWLSLCILCKFNMHISRALYFVFKHHAWASSCWPKEQFLKVKCSASCFFSQLIVFPCDIFNMNKCTSLFALQKYAYVWTTFLCIDLLLHFFQLYDCNADIIR